jgi:hypothetical protein
MTNGSGALAAKMKPDTRRNFCLSAETAMRLSINHLFIPLADAYNSSRCADVPTSLLRVSPRNFAPHQVLLAHRYGFKRAPSQNKTGSSLAQTTFDHDEAILSSRSRWRFSALDWLGDLGGRFWPAGVAGRWKRAVNFRRPSPSNPSESIAAPL